MMGTPSSSKKSRGLLRLTLIGLIVLLVGTVIHIRPYSVATPSAQALWNQNELYIFVEQNKVASSQNIWSFSWTVAQGPFGFKNTPAFHRLDCLVYRVTSSKIEEHLAKGWDVAGTIAPYKGYPMLSSVGTAMRASTSGQATISRSSRRRKPWQPIVATRIQTSFSSARAGPECSSSFRGAQRIIACS